MTHPLASNIAYDWAVRSFGEDHVNNVPVRALRMIEEAIELCQALHVPRETVLKCVKLVYSRPQGEPIEEIGALLLTTTILARLFGYTNDELLERELRRVLAKSPAVMKARNDDKIALGMTA